MLHGIGARNRLGKGAALAADGAFGAYEYGIRSVLQIDRSEARAEARAVDALAIGNPVDGGVMRAHQQVFIEDVKAIRLVVEREREVGTAIVKCEPALLQPQHDYAKSILALAEDDLLALPFRHFLCAAQAGAERWRKRQGAPVVHAAAGFRPKS